MTKQANHPRRIKASARTAFMIAVLACAVLGSYGRTLSAETVTEAKARQWLVGLWVARRDVAKLKSPRHQVDGDQFLKDGRFIVEALNYRMTGGTPVNGTWYLEKEPGKEKGNYFRLVLHLETDRYMRSGKPVADEVRYVKFISKDRIYVVTSSYDYAKKRFLTTRTNYVRHKQDGG